MSGSVALEEYIRTPVAHVQLFSPTYYCCVPSLQNIHLVAKWLSKLEKTLEHYSEGSHNSYRVYMSAEPAPIPESHIIPQGILESSIKITNEPPTGMLANLHKALDNFNQVCICSLVHVMYM